MTPTNLQFTLTEAEYSDGLKPLLRAQLMRSRLFLLGVMLGLTIFILFLNDWKVTFASIIPLVPSALFTVWGLWRIQRITGKTARKIYRQSRTIQAPTSVVIDDAGITFNTYFLTSHSRWDRFSHWQETKLLIILYDGRSPMIFPNRAFQDIEELRAFRQVCDEQIRNKKYQPPLKAFAIVPSGPPPLPSGQRDAR